MPSKLLRLYKRDFVAWADEQTILLQQRRFDELDLANLVEEVKDLGGKHRDAIESQLTRLLLHLLKWQYQPGKRSTSWFATIKESRKQITRLIHKHPVLKLHIETSLLQCYMYAREDASDETGLSISIFPLECPYDIDDILGDFFPTDM